MSSSMLLRVIRWAVSGVLSLALGGLLDRSSMIPTAVSFSLLGLGLVGCVGWVWARCHNSLDQEGHKERRMERVAAVLLIATFLVGGAAWEAVHEERISILKSGEKTVGNVISKSVRFEGRVRTFEVTVMVEVKQGSQETSADVSLAGFRKLSEGSQVALSYVLTGGRIQIASEALPQRELALPYWMALFLGLIGGVWTEMISRRSGHRG